jgi:para-nitrobenzyl esterase
MQRMPYTAAVMLRLLAAALVAVLMLGPSASPAQTTGPTVAIDAGRLAGTVDDAGMRSFRGIPYAAPPVGDLRWREPQPVAHWAGVRDAHEFGDRCQQSPFPPATPIGNGGLSENCLFLNVWAAPAAVRAPVLVWIHGGGYSNGYSNAVGFEGDAFAQKGLVFVSINYRVGAFGFLAHPALTQESPHKTSGNYGALDQIAALQWVRRNIAAFGGDPNNVTIFGESAGSVSVSVLTASPLAKGLFKRAIGDSGAGLGSTVDSLPVKPLPWQEQRGLAFARVLHARTAAELRAIPAGQIVDAGEHGAGTLFLGGRYAPIIDGYLLRETPERTFARGAQNNVSLLTGWNSREGLLFSLVDPNGAAAVGCKPVWDDARTATAFVNEANRSFGAAAPAFLQLYPHGTDDEARMSAENAIADLTIDWATWKWADLQSKNGKTSVYAYLFAKVPPPEYPLHAATHGSETPYAFDNLKARKWSWDSTDVQIAHIMSSYYVNFARTGDPNGPGLPQWPAYTGTAPQRMVFDANGAAAAGASLARIRLIDVNRSAGPWCPDAR